MPRSVLLEQVRREIRLRGVSLRTEKTYLVWIRRYLHCHHLTQPAQLGAEPVKAFLSWLANDRNVAVNRAVPSPDNRTNLPLSSA
jgi:hypothetical protein